MNTRLYTAAFSMALLGGSASAASLDSLAACTRIQDDRARLACFDREAAALHLPPAPGASASPAITPQAAPATAPAVTVAPLTPEQKMGLRQSQVDQIERPAGQPPAPKITGFTAQVTAVTTNVNQHLVITLDNGQVWEQTDLSSTFSVKAGDTVQISKGSLGGAFFISVGKHSSTRAKRLH